MSVAPSPIQDEGTPPPAEEGAPMWTVTFGDMMSLLMTFFVLLYSMSQIENQKFLAASASLREAFGGGSLDSIPGLAPDSTGENPSMLQPGAGSSRDSAGVVAEGGSDSASVGGGGGGDAGGGGGVDGRMADEVLERLAREIRAFVEERRLGESLLIEQGPSGVRVRIQSGVLFAPGSATLASGGGEILAVLAELTSGMGIPVAVSGHADNQPVRSAAFASNWELSAARAAGVARELVLRGHDPAHVRVESFGEYRPVAPNETAEGRARNRRVELFYDRRDVIETIAGWRAGLTTASHEPAKVTGTDVAR